MCYLGICKCVEPLLEVITFCRLEPGSSVQSMKVSKVNAHYRLRSWLDSDLVDNAK